MSEPRHPVGGPLPLELDQVTFGFGRVPVLREASLAVPPGQFVAVVGANGSGKTTLMRLALGLLRPTHGTVRLFGTELSRFRDHHLVGYVPQRANTSTTLPVSVGEVVRTGLAGSLGLVGRPRAEHRDRMTHVLDLMGLAGLARRRMTELSGGQQQRALIARALVMEPRLLVLDEPTTGVDAAARSSLREALEHLVEVERIAVVYVSHDPEGFSGLAHRVVEVRAGRIVPISTAGHRHPAPADGP